MRYFIFLFCCLYINAQEGPKTHIMLQELDKGILLNYDPQKKTFQHQGKEFIPLRGSTQGISHIPVASIGSSPISREIILLDPVTSPLLMQAYDSLSSAEDLMRFIRE